MTDPIQIKKTNRCGIGDLPAVLLPEFLPVDFISDFGDVLLCSGTCGGACSAFFGVSM